MPEEGMKTKTPLQKRLQRLRRALTATGLDGAVVAPGPNMSYLTGVESLLLERPLLLLVPARGDLQLVAPALESGPYARSPLRMKIHPWTDSDGPGSALKAAAIGARVGGRWGIEGRLPYGYLHRLMSHARFIPEDCESILQGLREVKDSEEAELIKEAGSILSRAFEKIPDLLAPGKTELEVARKFSDIIYSEGATRVDDVLVQSGPRAADPHSLPSSRRISRGESIVVDVGSTFKGYYADITRTFCIGAPNEVKEVYDVVLEAEEAGIQKASAGAEVGAVDRAARSVIERAGLGKNFFHRTGHGLGLEIHEAPYIVEGGTERLRSGMCFTVEPGAYLKGRLGVRIEDDVLVQGKMGREITDAPKDYGWWS